MKQSIVIIIFVLFPYLLPAQRAFIATDSSLSKGVVLIKGTKKDNYQFIQVKKGIRIIKYSPNQLTAYGFNNGESYSSKEITINGKTKKVFLKRLQRGAITLYYYEETAFKTFFMTKVDNTFIELTAQNFKQILAEQTDEYDWMASQIEIVTYSEKSMSNLISIYNNGKYQPMPLARFGFSLGVIQSSLLLSNEIKASQNLPGNAQYIRDFDPNISVSFAAFVDIPINMNLSFNTGTSFYIIEASNRNFSGLKTVKTTTLSIPLLFRYTFNTPKNVLRPYVNGGLNFDFTLNSKNEEGLPEKYISDFMKGISLGVGMQYHAKERNIFALEYRFNQFYGKEITYDMSISEFVLSVSF